ncbi:MAG: AlpA family transcriptional regulator [Henriciella sp.]|nr:AlpA family transcriptional regulator [Henriciella sp.]MBO6694964.1 AlpA family transcriptional regulator [Henriciella sp.]
MTNKILRREEVLNRTGLSVSTLYYFMKEGRFPQRIKLGVRSVGWLEKDIDDWINSRRGSAGIDHA